jgi:hypothetical protein
MGGLYRSEKNSDGCVVGVVLGCILEALFVEKLESGWSWMVLVLEVLGGR